MLRVSLNFFWYYIFRKENLLTDFLPENTHKMTHKVRIKHSQNSSKKSILGLCTFTEFTRMDQDEPEINSYIPVDTPTKLKVHKTFFDV